MKFISNLIENEEYVHQMKKVISDTLNELFNENILDEHVKGNIWNTILDGTPSTFLKKIAKNTNKKSLT